MNEPEFDQVSSPEMLKRALVELTFPPTLSVARSVYDFHRGLPQPYAYSPINGTKPFDSASSQGYKFVHPDGNFEIRLFADSLTMAATGGNPWFETFRTFVLETSKSAGDHFGLGTLSRVGLKYENSLVLVPEEGKYKLGDYCTPLLNVDDPDVEAMEEFVLALKSARPNGGLTLRSSFRSEILQQGELAGQPYGIYSFDFDSFRTGPVDFGLLESCLGELHIDIKSAYNRHVKVREIGGND